MLLCFVLFCCCHLPCCNGTILGSHSMTTDKTTTVWSCVCSSRRLNRLKTHMKMVWIPERGVRWLKSHSDSSRPLIQFMLLPHSHKLITFYRSAPAGKSQAAEDSQQKQWEESCKSPPNHHHHHRPRLVPGRWPCVSAPLRLLEHSDLQEWSLFTSLAPRCSPKQSWRLKQEQRAGKGESNLSLSLPVQIKSGKMSGQPPCLPLCL